MKRKLLIFGATFFVALFLFACFMLYRDHADSKHSADTFELLASLVSDEPTMPVQSGDIKNSYVDGIKETKPQITPEEKYSAVYEKNNDFVGWIKIDDTNINYPVMQTTDDPNFYLKHNFEKDYSNYGVPYIQANLYSRRFRQHCYIRSQYGRRFYVCQPVQI